MAAQFCVIVYLLLSFLEVCDDLKDNTWKRSTADQKWPVGCILFSFYSSAKSTILAPLCWAKVDHMSWSCVFYLLCVCLLCLNTWPNKKVCRLECSLLLILSETGFINNKVTRIPSNQWHWPSVISNQQDSLLALSTLSQNLWAHLACAPFV